MATNAKQFMNSFYKNILPITAIIVSWEFGQYISSVAYTEYRKFELKSENRDINSDAFYFEINRVTVEMIPISFENRVKDLSVYPEE